MLHFRWDFCYPVNRGIISASSRFQPMRRFVRHPRYMPKRDLNFLITVNASPSTHTSLKPKSSVKMTAYRHARASAMVGSQMFSHG
ncbi:hypothetical protein ES332_A06G135100v1 [Gossypium tomentosum]|uniref:Uncharacterized protein n=1 Tax=Gossypium tomentosum TaxID=34277 RepID=A0A5D2Q3J4_GOSTO|nr:hypothetical protein ES332_A06G135100v1 [Gossypium tomentosum]